MSRFLAAVMAFCFLLCSSLTAFADDATRLGVKFKSQVSGKQLPGLVIEPAEDVKSVTVKLKRGDGKTLNVSARNVAAGTSKNLDVRQGPGTFDYTGHFKVVWGSGEKSTFKMKFSLSRAQKLALTIKPENVDLGARKMGFSINNPAGHAELVIFGKGQKKIKTVKRAYNRAKAGSLLEITWPDPGADILYMELKVYDASGFWKGVRLTPFSIHIKHDDVEFESGKWKIRNSEEHKLKSTMSEIKKALDEHGTLLTLKLYIAGYTDTVGAKGSNDTLSRNRARSIARWFRKHRLKIPIFYQGFGERVLAVSTPDNTDEQRNRRALYILSSQPPKGGQIPDDNWKKL
jgi:outer membrane protein OmpA-like peptidoglycan-associated protein